MLGLLQSGDLDEAGALARPSLTAVLDRAEAAGLRLEDVALGRVDDLPPGLALTVHRVLQEALTNAAKHAPGSRVQLRLEVAPEQVELTVRDDGAAAPPTPGLSGGEGITGMRERVALYGGTLHAETCKGDGFEVRAVIPRSASRTCGAPVVARVEST